MCDQTEVKYEDDAVVWVKIGPIWWPGVVKDLDKEENGAEILAGLKKKPIAAVKFFDEDNFEYVKSTDHIHIYNCKRKDEFIKKGLDKFRSGASHMQKFPLDVTKAETILGGDVNIINDPKFQPEEKQSYSDIFGSGKKKNKKDKDKDHTPRMRGRPSTSLSTPLRQITHQRFIDKARLGHSDHKVKTLIQPSGSPDDSSGKSYYKCHVCKFTTTRVNVIVAHHRLSHSIKNSINWTSSDSKIVRKKPVHKSRKIKTTKKVLDFSKELSSDDEVLELKRSPTKSKKSDKKSPVKTKDGSSSPSKSLSSPGKRKLNDSFEDDVEDNKKPRYTDVLLADWSEDEDEKEKEGREDKEEEVKDENKNEVAEDVDDSNEKMDDSESKTENASLSDEDSRKEEPEMGTGKKQNQKMSCFDFDEEEEGFIGMSNANTYGRKIPRVIPVKDKSDLGVDLEIEELFKRKSESETDEPKDLDNQMDEDNASENQKVHNESMEEEIADPGKATDVTQPEVEVEENVSEQPEKATRRRRKSSKDQDKKATPPVNVEDSLAMRRARRPGAKKSYLNEVIEKIDEAGNRLEKKSEQTDDDLCEISFPEKSIVRRPREEVPASSSRRKQDLKSHTLENDRDDTLYPEVLGNEQPKPKATPKSRAKSKRQSESSQSDPDNDDLSLQINNLLAESSVPSLPSEPPVPAADKLEKPQVVKSPESGKSSTLSFSFDYVPSEQSPKKSPIKSPKPEKSISRMFAVSLQAAGGVSDTKNDSGAITLLEETKEPMEVTSEEQKTVSSEPGVVKVTPTMVTSPTLVKSVTSNLLARKRGPLVLSSLPKTIDSPVTVLPVVKTTISGSDSSCVVLPGGKKVGLKKIMASEIKLDSSDDATKEANTVSRPNVIKTIKIKPDSIRPSLLTSGKFKGQALIQQKDGKLVIMAPTSQAARQKLTVGKPTTGNKYVILRNQHGEQKIINASGLQQSKFKIDTQKLTIASESGGEKVIESPSTSGILSMGKTQPMIKMVPDGKGGIVKQLTISPKKVLLKTTASPVLGSQSTTVQKIALPSGSSLGGDYKLIENYKGKTVLIQGSPGSNVVLKQATAPGQRQIVNRVIQSPQNIISLKKKPKILMRSGQNDFIVQSCEGTVETPTYVMKRKGADGKLLTQKIIRRQVVNPKTSLSSSQTYFLSPSQTTQKGESIIVKASQEPVTNKIVRLKQKVRTVEAQPLKSVQKLFQKAPETYTVTQNNLIVQGETTEQVAESDQQQQQQQQPQIVQIQEQEPQPVMQTQVMAMPGPIGADGNQTYVIVSLDEFGNVQSVDNSIIAYDTTAQSDQQVFLNSAPSSNQVILINPQSSEELKPVYSNAGGDILAEALANTNVLEGSINSEIEPVMPSILLPPSIPSSVVQETSITLQKPIMTPLEMPSNVAPDTSGLEPPPLPPTPTEEDVLMEDQSELQIEDGMMDGQVMQHEEQLEESTEVQEETQVIIHEVPSETYVETETNHCEATEAHESFQETNMHVEEDRKEYHIVTQVTEDGEQVEYHQKQEEYEDEKSGENQPPREDFIIENSQEDQGGNSFQSMPLLNDEPDTSDDAQGSEPIADQDFELQKSRMENSEFAPMLREQEPPSSTNNEMITESNYENHEGNLVEGRYETYVVYQDESNPNDLRHVETCGEQIQQEEELKEKDSGDNRDTQSMPIIAEDANVNTYEIDPIYADVISQKRFQEETEVTSTTDEYSNKDNV